jgi:hypothetical protein
MLIVGHILDTVAVVGTMCEESGKHVNVGLLRRLLCLVRIHCFAFSVVTQRGYKGKRSPLRTHTFSHIINCYLLVLFLALEEREREKEVIFWA